MDVNNLIEHISMCGTDEEIALLREVQAAMLEGADLADVVIKTGGDQMFPTKERIFRDKLRILAGKVKS